MRYIRHETAGRIEDAWDVCGVQKKSLSQQTELFFPETQQYRTVAPELGLTFCRVRCFGCLLLHHRPPQSPGGLKQQQLVVPPHSVGWPSFSSAVFLSSCSHLGSVRCLHPLGLCWGWDTHGMSRMASAPTWAASLSSGILRPLIGWPVSKRSCQSS